jgi:hypothetical protein
MRNHILHKTFAFGAVVLCLAGAVQAQSFLVTRHSSPQNIRVYYPFPVPALVDANDPMLPLPKELLSEPIKLSGACESVSIVEWKPTPGNEWNTSYQDKKAIDLIDEYCNEAMQAFLPFAKSYDVTVGSLDRFYHRISLLPAVVKDHGADPRALNDRRPNSGRFRYRQAGGESIWGYTLEKNRISFLDNGVFTRNHTPRQIFKDTVVHELFHAMSIFAGTSKQWSDNDEETHAEKFEKYVSDKRYE